MNVHIGTIAAVKLDLRQIRDAEDHVRKRNGGKRSLHSPMSDVLPAAALHDLDHEDGLEHLPWHGR